MNHSRTSRRLSYGVAAVALLGVLSLLFVTAPAAQNPQDARIAAASAKPTPRLADGHPDFGGFYGGPAELGDPVEEDGGHVVKKAPDGSVFFSYGGANTGGQIGLEAPGPTGGGNGIVSPGQAPPYKPEYMAKHKQVMDTVYGWTSVSIPRWIAGLRRSPRRHRHRTDHSQPQRHRDSLRK